MSFDPNPTIVDDRRKVDSADLNVEDLLYSILTELKINNMHLAKLTDEAIDEGDL